MSNSHGKFLSHNWFLITMLFWLFGMPSSLDAQHEPKYPDHCQQDLQKWLPVPDKVDMMVFTCHPDDEGIFFGGSLPYYSQVQKKVIMLVGMTGPISGIYDRQEELERAAWHYGLRHQPINFLYPDVSSNVAQQWEPKLGEQGVINRVATEIRRFKPEVVLTHDLNGEYGHAAHILTAISVEAAYSVAADDNVDLEGLPPWQTKKLYLHRYNNPGDNNAMPDELVSANGYMYHSWEEQFDEFDGKSSRDIANEALHCHQDAINVWPDLQVCTRAVVGEVFDFHHSEDWGLRFSEVGPDETHSDFFQNLPPVETKEIPLVNSDFTDDQWMNEEIFIQNTGLSSENLTGWITEGLVRGYHLNIDGDDDPTMNSGDQIRIWGGWLEHDGFRQIGFQSFQDPENSIWQDAGIFEEGREYKFSIRTGPGFEAAIQDAFLQIRRASDDTLLNERTFPVNLNGSETDFSQSQSVSYTATAADEGSAIRVRFGTQMLAASGTAVFANPKLEVVVNSIVVGDVNCDGEINLLDVDPFVELLTTGGFSDKADINQDGVVDLLDVAPFIALLSDG